MDLLLSFGTSFLGQLQTPSLAFLIGGGLAAALGSKLKIPNAIYQIIVFMLLVKIGMDGGVAIRQSDFLQLLVPALFAALAGLLIVLAGSGFFALTPGVKRDDGLAAAGLFGAVSSATMVAGMLLLRDQNIFFEPWVPALYPFMDIPALVLAIALANYRRKGESGAQTAPTFKKIVKDSLQGGALSALLLGVALGIFTRPEPVMESFYAPLFQGLLTILMLVMGMEAFTRLADLKTVAHWFGLYAVLSPIVHGFIGFGLGYVAHILTGFSPGGAIMLAIIAASNSDISGPPTLRAGIPEANPSAYVGASTGLGTPVAIAICIPLFTTLGRIVFQIPG